MNNFPQVIGLSGVARSGKDTVAKILADLYGYETASFSDALNRALIALNPWVPPASMKASDPWVRYATLIEQDGYEAAKEIPEVRRLLQAMGTEVGRKFFGESVWVDALFKTIGDTPTAIVNVRFPNEYDAVKERGGVVWRVERPGYTAALGHISDTALDDHVFDTYIHNDGSLTDLSNKVIDLMYILEKKRVDRPVFTR